MDRSNCLIAQCVHITNRCPLHVHVLKYSKMIQILHQGGHLQNSNRGQGIGLKFYLLLQLNNQMPSSRSGPMRHPLSSSRNLQLTIVANSWVKISGKFDYFMSCQRDCLDFGILCKVLSHAKVLDSYVIRRPPVEAVFSPSGCYMLPKCIAPFLKGIAFFTVLMAKFVGLSHSESILIVARIPDLWHTSQR